MSGVLLESRPYRPFKSSEEYLVAMREDLAEWLQEMYPHLAIIADNFMEKLETGVPLCAHANAVKSQAYEYVQKKQARKIMARSITGSLATAQNLVEISDVKYISCAKPSTFFARDNVSNFIHWCKTSLQIIDCLLFESDDLIMRKNEKHVILCLLEVARKGAKFGVPAPMLVQMERQIDREIAADQRKLLLAQQQQQQQNNLNSQSSLDDDESDSEVDDEQPMMIYGPLPQIITNDLKSLDEMVRDLVEKCTCPTQFKMIRLSEGKYRIGDTNTLIFVRILRNHVMVRVGGGWDTLSHYLDKHDPCRCRSQHKSTMSARLVNKPGAADLSGAHVYYDRSNVSGGPQTTQPNPSADKASARLGPPMHSLNRSRSRSPSGIPTSTSTSSPIQSRRSVSPGVNSQQQRRTLAVPQSSGNYRHRSRSPTPNFTSTHTAKLLPQNQNLNKRSSGSGPQSLPIFSPVVAVRKKSVTHVSSLQIPLDKQKSEAVIAVEANGAVMGETQSDNGSEVSDEGYRSLGLIDKSKYRTSVCSPNSSDDAEYNEQHDSIIDLEDETNDCGLRKTQYSMQIYGDQPDSSPPAKKPQTPSVSRNNSLETQKPENKASKQASPILFRAAARKSISATNKTSTTINGSTWSGRSNKPRASITSSTFQQPQPQPQQHFARNSGSRMSVGSLSRRGSQSANTSPIKSSRLKDEILKTLHTTDDEQLLVEQVHKLIKQHSSVSLYAAGDGEEGIGGYRRRRDSRPDTYVSRIPGPKVIA